MGRLGGSHPEKTRQPVDAVDTAKREQNAQPRDEMPLHPPRYLIHTPALMLNARAQAE